MKEKKYFHQVSQQEVESLIRQGLSWEYVRDNYKQPDWCGYPNPLNGKNGCWSLTNLAANGEMRRGICIDFCKTCIAFKKDYHENND